MSQNTVQFTAATMRLLNRLDHAPVALKVSLGRAVDLENQLTVSHIAQRYLSKRGPDTLGVVTNRLRSSLWAAKARVTGGVLLSAIGSNVSYAGVHEFGFDGPVKVRAFTRRNRALDVYRVVRVEAVLNEDGSISRRARKSRQLAAQGVQRVRAHTRHAHYAERAPIRRGIADRMPAYGVALEKATLDYLKGGAS